MEKRALKEKNVSGDSKRIKIEPKTTAKPSGIRSRTKNLQQLNGSENKVEEAYKINHQAVSGKQSVATQTDDSGSDSMRIFFSNLMEDQKKTIEKVMENALIMQRDMLKESIDELANLKNNTAGVSTSEENDTDSFPIDSPAKFEDFLNQLENKKYMKSMVGYFKTRMSKNASTSINIRQVLDKLVTKTTRSHFTPVKDVEGKKNIKSSKFATFFDKLFIAASIANYSNKEMRSTLSNVWAHALNDLQKKPITKQQEQLRDADNSSSNGSDEDDYYNKIL